MNAGFLQTIINLITGLFNRPQAQPASEAPKLPNTMSVASTGSHLVAEQHQASGLQVIHPPAQTITQAKFFVPTTPLITSNFGMRILPGYNNNKPEFHNGLDFGANCVWGFPVVAPEDGVVFDVGVQPNCYGLTYVGIHGKWSNCYYFLCHTGDKNDTSSTLVKKGQTVTGGQVVGYTNHTGYSTGSHCHLSAYDRDWNCVDAGLIYKKYAPDVFATLRGYRFTGEMIANKTGRPEANI